MNNLPIDEQRRIRSMDLALELLKIDPEKSFWETVNKVYDYLNKSSKDPF